MPTASSRVFHQSILFACSIVLATAVTAVSTAVLARILSTREFGSFSFAVSFLLFVALIFDFGLFLPAARQAAAAPDPNERRKIVGAAFVAYVPVGVAFCLAVFGLSF